MDKMPMPIFRDKMSQEERAKLEAEAKMAQSASNEQPAKQGVLGDVIDVLCAALEFLEIFSD